MTNKRDLLKQFCTEISKHLTGDSNIEWFDVGCGLCTNLSCFADSLFIKYSELRVLREELRAEISAMPGTFSDMQYPFNAYSAQYHKECFNDTLYENKLRLSFIEYIKNEY